MTDLEKHFSRYAKKNPYDNHAPLINQADFDRVRTELLLCGFSAERELFDFKCRNKRNNPVLWRKNGLWGIDFWALRGD